MISPECQAEIDAKQVILDALKLLTPGLTAAKIIACAQAEAADIIKQAACENLTDNEESIEACEAEIEEMQNTNCGEE